MSPEARQAELVARYAVIEDPQERLAALVSRGKKAPALQEHERVEERRVQGCSSRVWLIPELAEGRCRFRLDADSSLVKGLALAVCEIYQDSLPQEVAAFEPRLLEELGLAMQLSPTRQHGLQQVRRVIREFAQAAAGTSAAP